MPRTLSKYADLIPLGAFAVVIGLVFLFARERSGGIAREREQAHSAAELRASALANEVSNRVSTLLGALVAARLRFTSVEDSVAEATFLAALDSVVSSAAPGLTGIAYIDPGTERIIASPDAVLGVDVTLQDTTVRNTYVRARTTKRQAATPPLEASGASRRVFVFDPLAPPETAAVTAVLVAELDPQVIYRVVTASGVLDTITGSAITHALYGPDNTRLTTHQPVPASWLRVRQPVRVADTEWTVEVAYEPPDPRAANAERRWTWVGGVALAFAVAIILYVLRRTIRTQREEIARRQAAEEAARLAAADARERARQARDLAAQLEAAQLASQRLSTSLDPDDVVELFLGGVAEILDADVASLYTFEEEGELLVGRRRMIFREIEGITDRLKQEDIRQVRAPVAMLPTLAEAVSTGEPYVVETAGEENRLLTGRGAGSEAAASSVTVPLMIAGHTVGVASWETYAPARRFAPTVVTFAQALAAPAAAALRTAELFASLEAERRRAAREALRFGAVLDQMADGVIVVNADGMLERSNEAATELLAKELARVPVEEWAARFDLVAVDGRPLTPSEFPLTRAMRGERVRRATFIVRAGWGTERHLSCSAGPILNSAGQPAGAAMVLRDVTDEHQYAEMLRHTNRELRRQAEVLEQVNQQLRDATKAKDQFLAMMSHELRTPINAIMGYSDLLDLGVKGTLNDDQRAMLNRVRETSRHLLELINEVLDLAKIGAGRMDLVLVDIDVRSIVERAAEQILPLAVAKGLSLEVEKTRRHGAVLARADETRLTQIIVNLLSNAVKFTSHGGVTIAYDEHDSVVDVHVYDTGPGIAADQVERIFEEFYQVEGGLSRATGGTGLGLSISRRFARLMGGDIRVHSEVGKGSRFTVRLPASASSQGSERAHEDCTVVVLSHDAQALVRLSETLAGAVRVLGTTEPTQVAALARRERPAIIALDARAPDHGAWRALGALQGEPGTASVPALLYAHQDDAGESALDFGVVTLLAKPLSVEYAADVVQRAAGGREDLTVTIADDDHDVRRILGEALTAAGCNVRTASSGGELLDLARRIGPHVVVTDLLMPGMDGVEVIAAMRAEPGLARIPVVALISREMATEEMALLSASVEALCRARFGQVRPTADLLRKAAERNGAGDPRGGVIA
jgi:PAS domain S-box-containing protein